MIKNINTGLIALLITVLLAACSAAPPTEPTTGFTPHSAPLKPASVTATNGYRDTIELAWEEVEGATSYQIWGIESTSYGASSSSTTKVESYASLLSRGFKLLDVVTSETAYKLKGESTNSSYVFSIVAMKAEKGTSSTSVLYSEPSAFVEGGTAGEIILSAVASQKSVSFSWNVSNLYSVLDNSRSPKALYSYRIYLMKKLTASAEWEKIELADSDADDAHYEIPSSALNIDTLYDFKLQMEIYSGESVINTIESDVYTITTDESFTPGRVEGIKATSGKKRGEVTLSWTAPALPEKDGIESVFRIDRTEDGEEWTTLDTTVTSADGVFSTTDTTLEDNTYYTYRIVNGYRIGEKSPVYQSNGDAEKILSVYSLWMPQNISFSFTENDDHNGGVLKVNYTYSAPAGDGEAKFYIGGTTWTENDFTSHNPIEEKEGSVYTVSVETVTPLTYYSFYFRFTFNGEEILRTTYSDVTVGETASRDDLITSAKATDDWVGQIRLSWTEDAAKLAELGVTGTSYNIYEGNTELPVTVEKDGDNRYVTFEADPGVSHTYRVKITAATPDGDYFGILEASGSALLVPQGLSASDSTSAKAIDITWIASGNSDVKYTLEYSTDRETWTELEYITDGEATLPAKDDGTDGNDYYFRLGAVNTEQGSTEKLYSEIETGSVFGPYGINPTVENNGLDPDKITIKWTAVKGAQYYIVKRNGAELAGRIRNTTVYEDKAESLEKLTVSVTPLSEEYTYTIVPYLDEKTPAVITDASGATTKGKLFASPKNVQATKGVAADSISVTWDSVENATKYKIEKKSVTLKNGVATAGPTIETDYTTETSYTEKNTSLTTSQFVRYIVSSVRTDDSGEEIVSKAQEGSVKVKNSLGYDEDSNIGYGLMSVSSLTVSTVENTSGFYEPFTKVTWSSVAGATSYKLTSSIGADTEIAVSSLSYSMTGTTDNGKSETEAGYLSYNADSGIYTYNDNGGLMTTTSFSGYSITAYHDTAANEPKQNATEVYRQPSEEDWVSILMTLLKPAFTAANTDFGGDWWITNAAAWSSPSDSFTYGTTGMTFNLYTNSISGNYPYAKNYLAISEYTDETNKIKLSTTANIQFDVSDNGGAGNLGTDPLKLIGYDGNGCVSIKPVDAKIKAATVGLRNINVNKADSSGSYTVTVSGSESRTIADDSAFVRVL